MRIIGFSISSLFEIPTLFSMLPDLKNKRILDLGCGFGEHCKRFIECGAKRVVGIDISMAAGLYQRAHCR